MAVAVVEEGRRAGGKQDLHHGEMTPAAGGGEAGFIVGGGQEEQLLAAGRYQGPDDVGVPPLRRDDEGSESVRGALEEEGPVTMRDQLPDHIQVAQVTGDV